MKEPEATEPTQPTQPTEPTESTGELLMAAARSMRRALGTALAAYDVTPGQARALRIATALDAPRLSELAEHLHIAPRSATEVVDALESRGLVERRPDRADRRATCVVATEEGLRLQELLGAARRRASEQHLATLAADDRAELDRILRLLT